MSPYVPRPGIPVPDDQHQPHLDRFPDRASPDAAGSSGRAADTDRLISTGSTESPVPADSSVAAVSLPSAASTFEFGHNQIAPMLQPGDLVITSGPLGVGKTALIQGIGAGLGVGERVLSPTFVIARVHRDGRLPLIHVDAYRLGSVREIDDLDLEAELAESVMVVEWGRGLVERFTLEHLLIELSFDRPESAGSPHNRPFDRPESAGSPHNRPFDGPESPTADARTARLFPFGDGWQARLTALALA